MDTTGRFPQKSLRGKQYILIMYSEHGNYIKAITMKDRSKEEFVTAYKTGLQFFDSRGLAPKFQRLDNEISNALKAYLTKHGITLDLAPPGQHRRNKAERAIRTFKNHFISILAGVDPTFPAHFWCTLIHQAEITINCLRESTCHPRMSAWDEINGPLDFSRTPMAPPGMLVTVHDKPDSRRTWAKHGTAGYYTGPALDHYRCYTTVIKDSGATRVTDTLAWHPHDCQMPTATPIELVTDAAHTLSNAMHTLAESNVVTADNVQPLQLLATNMDDNLRDLITLFHADDAAPCQRVSGDYGDIAQEPELDEPVLVAIPPTQPIQRVPEHNPGIDKHLAVPPGFAPLSETSGDNVPQTLPPSSDGVPSVTDNAKNQPVDDPGVTDHTKKQTVDAPGPPHPMAKQNAKTTTAVAPTTTSSSSSPTTTRPTRDTRRPSRFTHSSNQTTLLTDEWREWAKHPFVQLDSSGVPFFLAYPHSEDPSAPLPSATLAANTAVDLDAKGKKLTFATAMRGEDADIWLREHGTEISKLIDTGTARPRQWHDLPEGTRATYYSPQVKTKIKEGTKVYRVRGTIGGNHINYHGDTQAFTAAMQTIKLLLNTVVSSDHAKFMTADIKDFYLGTPLPHHEWMRVELKQIPHDVQLKYNLPHFAKNGAVLMEIMKGIYGLPQAGKLAQDRLVAHLATHGYHQAKHTPCLFTHVSRPIAFTLVVDDFGIKYTQAADAQHLLDALRELYVVTEDWGCAQKYVGITIQHDRQDRCMRLSMPNYISKALDRFEVSDIKGAHSPITYIPPIRGQSVQMVPIPDDNDTPLTAAETTRVQEIVGVFLFYARAVDVTMLTALSKISTQQSAPTRRTWEDTMRFLQYAKQYQDNQTIIRPSTMQLQAQSDASYLSETNARSRAGMLLHFGINDDGTVNGIVDAASCIIPTVCSSVAEAEYAALFLAGKEIISARHTLHDLGFLQSATVLKCDNSCAVGIANVTVKQKRSKAIDMRYHWIRDQVQQNKIEVTWEAGAENLADFFTKAHPVWHHKAMISTFVRVPTRDTIHPTTRSRRIAKHQARLHPI
jgi:hypothetical protein